MNSMQCSKHSTFRCKHKLNTWCSIFELSNKMIRTLHYAIIPSTNNPSMESLMLHCWSKMCVFLDIDRLFKHHFNPKCKHKTFIIIWVSLWCAYPNELKRSGLFANIAFQLYVFSGAKPTWTYISAERTCRVYIYCTCNNQYKYWMGWWNGSVYGHIYTLDRTLFAINKINTIFIVYNDRWFWIGAIYSQQSSQQLSMQGLGQQPKPL